MRINLNKNKDKKQSFSSSNGKKVNFENKNVGKDIEKNKKEDEVPSEIDEENDLLLKMDD